MKNSEHLSLNITKTTLKNLTADRAIIPREVTKAIVGGANDNFYEVTGKLKHLAASTNITITSTLPRI